MPCSSHHIENPLEVNSPPRSVLEHLIFAPLDSLSARVLNFLKALKVSNLFFKIITRINQEKSSTIRKNYFPPFIIDSVIGP